MKKIKFSLDKTFSINYTPISGAFCALKNLAGKIANLVLLVSLLAVTPAQAGESGIPDGLPLYMGTMLACSQATRADLSSHCYMGLVSGTWATIATKEPWWGLSVGCLLGAAKEAYDRNNNGVAAFDDFAYTCAAAALASYSTGKIITFYEYRNANGERFNTIAISKDF